MRNQTLQEVNFKTIKLINYMRKVEYESHEQLQIRLGVSQKQIEKYSAIEWERLIRYKDPETKLIEEELGGEINKALNTLTPRQAKVIELYFGLHDKEPETLEEIAQDIHLTSQRIQQIRQTAIRRLRHPSRSKALRPYLY